MEFNPWLLVGFAIGGLLGWFVIYPLISRLLDREAMSKKKNRKQKHDPLDYYTNRAESDAAKAAADAAADSTASRPGPIAIRDVNNPYIPYVPSSLWGYRGGAQAHRAGAPGSSIHGPGYGASAGTRPGVMDEFSGIDQMIEPAMQEAGFAVGVVRGVRSFKIDKLGRLTGVNYQAVWMPGENHAECRANGTDFLHALWRTSAQIQAKYAFGASSIPETAPHIDLNSPHPMNSCRHGFYAYYDGSDDYHQPGYVSAVVEGYGETVIGTRGFRSMKARIVALHIPDDVAQHLRRTVTRNYPEVPVFDTFEQMVSEVPPDSAGNEPTPDTDPDFWTRSA